MDSNEWQHQFWCWGTLLFNPSSMQHSSYVRNRGYKWDSLQPTQNYAMGTGRLLFSLGEMGSLPWQKGYVFPIGVGWDEWIDRYWMILTIWYGYHENSKLRTKNNNTSLSQAESTLNWGYCYRIFMRFDASHLLDHPNNQPPPVDWNEADLAEHWRFALASWIC
jgi:hypothetical protein